MNHLVRVPASSSSPAPRCRSIVAPFAFALLVATGIAAPPTAPAEENAGKQAGTGAADTAKGRWVATKEGSKLVVDSPERAARRAARKSRRAAARAAEKTRDAGKDGDKLSGTEGGE